MILGAIEMYGGSLDRAAVLFEEARSCYKTSGNRFYSIFIALFQARVCMALGEYEKAIPYCEDALAIAAELNSPFLVLNATLIFAWLAWARQNYILAVELCGKIISMDPDLPRNVISPEYVLGWVAISQGEYDRARFSLNTYLRSIHQKDNRIWEGAAYKKYLALHAVSILCLDDHQTEQAVRFFGAFDALGKWILHGMPLAEQQEHHRALAAARAVLKEEAFHDAFTAGQALTIDQALEQAAAYLT